eukprot:5683616-Amphidinium_carterae.1
MQGNYMGRGEVKEKTLKDAVRHCSNCRTTYRPKLGELIGSKLPLLGQAVWLHLTVKFDIKAGGVQAKT